MSTQSKTYSLSFLYKIRITDEEIIGTYDFRSHHLAWHDITSVRPNLKGQGLMLSNAGEDTSIYINPNVSGYSELVEIIRKRRSDLWGKQDIQTFHYGLMAPVYFSLSGVALIFYVFNSGNPNPNWFISLVEITIGLFLIGYAATCRIKLFFDGDKIVTKYIVWKRLIHARDISKILTEKPLIVQIGRKQLFSILFQNVIYLKLQNDKTLSLGNIKEDKSIFLNSLERWAKTYLLPPS